jgi:hypothetical protein
MQFRFSFHMETGKVTGVFERLTGYGMQSPVHNQAGTVGARTTPDGSGTACTREPTREPAFRVTTQCGSFAAVNANGTGSPVRTWWLMVAVGWSVLFAAIQPVRAETYEVGPGQELSALEEVPWESLEAGDVVLIHARSEPYRSKWVLCRRGTAEQPIIVRGVPAEDGSLPVIDGRDARTRSALNFWSEGRGVIKIGGANRPPDTTPAHIVIENLEVRSGRQPYRFTGRDGETPYLKNAASIFIEKGEHITIRGCTLHDSGNGLFSSQNTKELLVEGCSIHGNGVEGSIYEHNNYTSAEGITFQFNYFGPLREGCPGNNLKDRSAGMVVRYNWIEGGNRALDLVDARFETDSYRNTFVYGNVLVKLDDRGNNQVVHYGGDSDETGRYRKGALYFFHNTVVSYRSGTTTLFRLSTNDETVQCHNNIFYVTGPGRRLAVLAEAGQAELYRNWIKPDWRPSHSGLTGEIRERDRLVTGESPGFMDEQARDFRLAEGSPCIDAGGDLAEAVLPDHRPTFQYVPHASRQPRPPSDRPDLGAFEFPADR